MQPSTVGQIERKTQNRIVKLFRDELEYTYLGHWEYRPNNSNIEEELLTRYLSKKGYNPTFINKALHELRVTANNRNESLYTNNKNVYKLLRYGVQVKAEAGDGIRQSIVNQQKEFIGSFFSTVQFVFAGNDSEGLRYGTIGTPEKFFLKWKEDIKDTSRLQLDKYLLKLCNKKRLIEIIYDFVLFDGGIKKLPRAHQYFGIKAAQEHYFCFAKN